MTPQERQLVDDLFDRLSRLEQSPREIDAEAAIANGLRRAPNATYSLVQTVLVQDEALKQAHARIQELEGAHVAQPQAGGFLGSMRDALLGPQTSRGSVPTISPGQRPVWNSGQVIQNDPRQQNPAGNFGNPGGFGGGGSFLGTAAAAAAGMIGGSLLMNSFRGLTGGGHQQSLSEASSASANPWSNTSSGGDLSRDAGINDIGRTGGDQKQSFAEHASNDTDNDDDDDNGFDVDGFDAGGDTDYA